MGRTYSEDREVIREHPITNSPRTIQVEATDAQASVAEVTRVGSYPPHEANANAETREDVACGALPNLFFEICSLKY